MPDYPNFTVIQINKLYINFCSSTLPKEVLNPIESISDIISSLAITQVLHFTSEFSVSTGSIGAFSQTRHSS